MLAIDTIVFVVLDGISTLSLSINAIPPRLVLAVPRTVSSSSYASAVSYTHLTLPTILLV